MTPPELPVLVVVAPHYPSSDAPHAGGVLLHARLAEFAKRYRVHCVVPDSPENRAAAASVHAGAAPPIPVVVAVADADPARGRNLRQMWPALRGDLDIFTPRLSDAVRSQPEVLGLLAEAAVIEVHWGEYAHLVPLLREHAPQAALGVFLHDVLTHARRARSRTRGVRRRERLVYAVSHPLAQRQEVRLCNLADVVWVLKQADAQQLARRGVTTLLEVAQPWVDRTVLPPPPPTSPPTASFVAAFWRTENANAAAWLLDEVWPHVRRAVPDAELRLAGARPPAWLADLAARSPGVTLTGFVQDLAEEYRRALVCLAPLTDPSGLKVKVVQAMMHARPVVARPAALAGVPEAPSDVLGGVSDAPEVFAGHLSVLLGDRACAVAIGRRAAEWAHGHFDFAQDVSRAASVYRSLERRRWT